MKITLRRVIVRRLINISDVLVRMSRRNMSILVREVGNDLVFERFFLRYLFVYLCDGVFFR